MAFTYKDYEESETVKDYYDRLQNHQGQKPGDYQSKWQSQIDDIFGKIQNRGPFQYDINADAMYQQMVDRYMQQGQQAMMDTMGQAATMTGGYGNSYAQSVGQQTYQGYLQGANDMMPQFYKMALDRYQMEGDDLLQQYGLLSDQENTAYSRYMDEVNRYYSELDRLQGIYDSERDFEYSKYLGDRDFAYQLERDAEDDRRWQLNFDRMNSGGRSGGSGGRGGGGSGKKPSGATNVDMDSVLKLGYGPISPEYLAEKVNRGDVQEIRDGNVIRFENKPKKPIKKPGGAFGSIFGNIKR